jgi:CheY-like chemotaxis protein
LPEALDTAAKTMKGRREQTGAETILLVEDESMVSDVTTKILERFGYTVLAAGNGREALNLYEKQKDSISLVILDLIMPKMGGIRCLEKLREIDPEARILVTTGHSLVGVEEEAIEAGARGFLYKPFTIKQMLTAVREVLDSD